MNHLQAAVERKRCSRCSVDFHSERWVMALMNHFGKQHYEDLPAGMVGAVYRKTREGVEGDLASIDAMMTEPVWASIPQSKGAGQ